MPEEERKQVQDILLIESSSSELSFELVGAMQKCTVPRSHHDEIYLKSKITVPNEFVDVNINNVFNYISF